MSNDSAQCAIRETMCALREAFDPTSTQPPVGGGSDVVRFMGGDAVPLASFDFHAQDGCEKPYLWVRVIRRYRTEHFPAPAAVGTCGTQIVIALELGVGRCAVVDAQGHCDCDWSDFANEAEISLDDSWRIELAMCRASTLIKAKNCADLIALDTIEPYGPEGGVIAWTGTIYVQLG